MRTIKDILAENPHAKFSCKSVEYGALDEDDLLDQIHQCYDEKKEMPIITYCTPSYFSMNAESILQDHEEYWDMAYEGWTLQCTHKLMDKLQAVLDEIVAYNENGNISYSEGEELDITEVWNSLEELSNVS